MRIIDVPEDWRAILRVVGEVSTGDIERHLTDEERADVESLRVQERRLERAASRIAGKLLLADLMNLEDPGLVQFAKREERPFVRLRGARASVSVSFSHSHGLGGAAVSESPVGVDLEKRRAIRPEMTRFFLTSREFDSAAGLSIPDALLHFWSAKEAAFKMSAEFPTLLKVPLELSEALPSGLTFRVSGSASIVQTRLIGDDFVVALARVV